MVYAGELYAEHPLKPIFILIQAGISCKWTYDSQRFLLESFDLISKSPSHIYHSALPLSPSSSWLHKHYAPHLLQEVQVVGGLLAEWGACSRTVSLDSTPGGLACWKDTIAVSLGFNIIILSAITGNQVAVLSEHTDEVKSLTFSFDGTMLVSGSEDTTVKLWDVQTGGVIKTFCGHTNHVLSVSISPDSATLASGSSDTSIHLWGVSTGECFCVINIHDSIVTSLSFSPTNSQQLVSASLDGTVRQWSINGCQIGPTHKGYFVAFSLDGTHFVSWMEQVAIVWNVESGAVITELQVSSDGFNCCCFSPNGELIAGSVGHTIYVWDITYSVPHLFKTLTEHIYHVVGLTFSSSLISVAEDQSIRFWQIGIPFKDSVATDTISTPPASTPIMSVSLQTRKGVVISSDSAGVVKTWDILTGLCKASFKTPATAICRDVQLVEGRLILVWYAKKKIYIWDTEKGALLQTIDVGFRLHDLKISGDGSKVFSVANNLIQSWLMWTGAAAGKAVVDDGQLLDPLYADGSRIWVCSSDSSVKGWDFGILGSSPIPLSTIFPDRPHLNYICGSKWLGGTSRIKDTEKRFSN